MDKYILCVFSHNKFSICREMASWGVSGPQTGSRTTPLGGFPCGFNTVDHLGPLYEAGQAMSLRGRRTY